MEDVFIDESNEVSIKTKKEMDEIFDESIDKDNKNLIKTIKEEFNEIEDEISDKTNNKDEQKEKLIKVLTDDESSDDYFGTLENNNNNNNNKTSGRNERNIRIKLGVISLLCLLILMLLYSITIVNLLSRVCHDKCNYFAIFILTVFSACFNCVFMIIIIFNVILLKF